MRSTPHMHFPGHHHIKNSVKMKIPFFFRRDDLFCFTSGKTIRRDASPKPHNCALFYWLVAVASSSSLLRSVHHCRAGRRYFIIISLHQPLGRGKFLSIHQFIVAMAKAKFSLQWQLCVFSSHGKNNDGIFIA